MKQKIYLTRYIGKFRVKARQPSFFCFQYLKCVRMGIHHTRVYIRIGIASGQVQHSDPRTVCARCASKTARYGYAIRLRKASSPLRLRSSILLLDTIDRCSVEDTVFSYPIVSDMYFSVTITHTCTGKKRGGGSFGRTQSRDPPVLLPFECFSVWCGKEMARYVTEAEAATNPTWRNKTRVSAHESRVYRKTRIRAFNFPTDICFILILFDLR